LIFQEKIGITEVLYVAIDVDRSYCVTAFNAMHGLAVAILTVSLSICQTNEL